MPFKIFRTIVGVVVTAGAVWMIATGAAELHQALAESGAAATQTVVQGVTPAAQTAQTLSLVTPVAKMLGGLALMGVCWYGLWSSSRVKTSLENIFAIPELLRKIGFTLLLLCIYRIGFHVPLPGIDQAKLSQWVEGTEGLGRAMRLMGMLTGGGLGQSSLFGLGIMPYISASIIFQLLATVIPSLERLQKEGPAGHKKIQEYTRYATVGLCLLQAAIWMSNVRSAQLMYPEYLNSIGLYLTGIVGLTAGTIFLMWLGEQIDEYGIGNGISLLIMAGIVARMPNAIQQLLTQASLSLAGTADRPIGLGKLLFLVIAFVGIVAGAILITQGQRRIPVQQAKHARGRRMYGGQRQHLPLRVNHGGVMPIIFASTLMVFPGLVFGQMAKAWHNSGVLFLLEDAFKPGSYTYAVVEIGLIFFFAYFWTTVQFKPKEMAENLRDHGSFIPGFRPGKRTAEHLERVMERITYCGAAFLALIAVLPTTISAWLKIDPSISSFLGGTGLLIMVSVALDLVQRIEANLVMRNYGGFLGGSTRIKGAYS